MDYSKNNKVGFSLFELVTKLQVQNEELTKTVERLTKIAFAFQAKIADLEETIQQEFPRETLTAIDVAKNLDQFLATMDEEQPETVLCNGDYETIHSDPILTKTKCNITKAFQADALDNMDYGQF